AELGERIAVDRQVHGAFFDGADLLRRDVLRSREDVDALPDAEAVEDVQIGSADDLLHRPDFLPVRIDDVPARLDHRPGDGVRHQTVLPPSIQTGPCVPTGWVSERTRTTRTSPGMRASSRRDMQRRAIPGDPP